MTVVWSLVSAGREIFSPPIKPTKRSPLYSFLHCEWCVNERNVFLIRWSQIGIFSEKSMSTANCFTTTVVYCGLLWATVVYCGLLWSTVVYCGLLWSTVVYCGLWMRCTKSDPWTPSDLRPRTANAPAQELLRQKSSSEKPSRSAGWKTTWSSTSPAHSRRSTVPRRTADSGRIPPFRRPDRPAPKTGHSYRALWKEKKKTREIWIAFWKKIIFKTEKIECFTHWGLW